MSSKTITPHHTTSASDAILNIRDTKTYTYNDLPYYYRTTGATGVTTSDLGPVPSVADRKRLQALALEDTVLQRVCEEEISLAYLIRPPKKRASSSSSHFKDRADAVAKGSCFAYSADTVSIYPKIFELHVPCDVLTYLFYTIGKEYPLIGGGRDGEFDIDEHEKYAAVVARGEPDVNFDVNDDNDDGEEKKNIKQVSYFLNCFVASIISENCNGSSFL